MVLKTSLFESIINNDMLEKIASFVDCKDLVSLSLTSKQLSSSVEEVAVRMINSSDVRYGGDDKEDLSVIQELNYLRCAPIEFTDLLGDRIGHVGGDKACVYSSNPNRLHSPFYIGNVTMEGLGMDWEGSEQTAICGHYVMRRGKHYAKFTISTCDPINIFRYVYCRIGIMRPISSGLKSPFWTQFSPLHTPWFNDFLAERTDAWGEDKHCCLYYDFKGTCEWSNWARNSSDKHEDRWDGMRGFSIYDGELGLLLDLDEGTLTVYKDGTRLGVMMNGLSGEYTWVVEITAQANGNPDEQNVRIERAPIPSSLAD